MTNQEKKIKQDMVDQFLHWAKYNPTMVKEKFGVSVEGLKMIIENLFKK
jgi:hypothetical protein